MAGADERTFVLQTASRPACKVGDRAVIGWSIGGELHELRTRVVRGIGVPSELSVARHGIITRTGDRRGAARFVLVAGGSLLLDDREVLGFTHDLSVHGVGLLLDGETPALGTRGALEVRDALGVLLPRTEVRVVHTSETRQPGVARVGLRFDDPQRVAAATEPPARPARVAALRASRHRLRGGPRARSRSRAARPARESSKSQPRPASTPAVQSSEPTRMRSSVPPSLCASSASVGGRRRAAWSTGRSSSTSTSHRQGTRASDWLTCPTASNPVRRLDRRLVREPRGAHAIDAEGAQIVAAVVERGEVPAPVVHDEAVRAQLASRPLARERAVRRAHAPAAPDRVGQQQCHHAADRGGARRAARETERLLQRLHLTAQRGGEHAQDLLERAVHRICLALGRETARADQAEHDRHGLVVGQHQRREAVAGADAVAAADAALPLDRDVERLQRRHVAPHGASVDLEPPRDLPAGRERLRLQDLEQLEQP